MTAHLSVIAIHISDADAIATLKKRLQTLLRHNLLGSVAECMPTDNAISAVASIMSGHAHSRAASDSRTLQHAEHHEEEHDRLAKAHSRRQYLPTKVATGNV